MGKVGTSRKGNCTRDRRVPAEPSEDFRQFVKFAEQLAVARDWHHNALEDGIGDPEVASNIRAIKTSLNVIEHTFATVAAQGIKHPAKAGWMIPLFKRLAAETYYDPAFYLGLARTLAVHHGKRELDGDLDQKEILGIAHRLLEDMGDERLREIARERDRALERKRERARKTIEAALGRREGHNRSPLGSGREWERMYG